MPVPERTPKQSRERPGPDSGNVAISVNHHQRETTLLEMQPSHVASEFDAKINLRECTGGLTSRQSYL